MKRICLFFLMAFAVAGIQAEDLEYLWTSTSVYTGIGSLTGASAYAMPSENSTYVGWLWFPAGLTLSSGFVSGFNILGSVDGVVTLNDGTLSTTGDLYFASSASIVGDGKINGQGNALILQDQLSLNSTLSFIGDTIIDGQNNVITLGAQAELWIDNNTTVTFQNIVLKDLSDTKLIMQGTGSKLVFDNSGIWLDGDYSFTQGSIFFHNDVFIAGSTHQFSYQSAQSSYIAKQSMLTIDHGVQFSYDPAGAFRDLIVMDDDTSHLYLDSCMLYSTPTGLRLTNGTVFFDGLVTLSADGQQVSEAIAFGNPSGNDLTTIMQPGTRIEVYGYVDVN